MKIRIREDDASSSEEEKQWFTTKEKLLKRLGKKLDTPRYVYCLYIYSINTNRSVILVSYQIKQKRCKWIDLFIINNKFYIFIVNEALYRVEVSAPF